MSFNNIKEAIRELEELFIYEEILTKEDLINNGWSSTSFNRTYGEDCLFVICCEFMPINDKYHLHYDLDYWGSNEMNNILNKYDLKFDWVDSCSVKVYSH